ncbi:hypothetical protein J6590_019916 [Homalodisca vitripennis]|nr:hypothetical protein J6590_019916 [Homalodisca vitripennis]
MPGIYTEQTGDRVRGGLQVSGRYLLCPVSLTVAFFRNLYRTDRGRVRGGLQVSGRFFRNLYRTDRGQGQGRAASVRSVPLMPGQSDSGFLQESIPNRPGIGSGEGCKCQIDTSYARRGLPKPKSVSERFPRVSAVEPPYPGSSVGQHLFCHVSHLTKLKTSALQIGADRIAKRHKSGAKQNHPTPVRQSVNICFVTCHI